MWCLQLLDQGLQLKQSKIQMWVPTSGEMKMLVLLFRLPLQLLPRAIVLWILRNRVPTVSKLSECK